MKQLICMVSEQSPRQNFQVDGHNFKVKNQNDLTLQRSHGRTILMCPENMKKLPCIHM